MELATHVTLGSSMYARASQTPQATEMLAPTGCRAIDDAALDGGFRFGEITMIAGSSGSGKTLVSSRKRLA